MKMVQKKVSNKLGIQATTLIKTGIIKPSIRTEDNGKIKVPDLRIKKMKKSRPNKRPDIEIGLGSSPKTPKKFLPSPCKSSSNGSPNYMKSTSSSEARKEERKVSVSSSSRTNKGVKGLSRDSSLKRVRTLMKAPSFKHTRMGLNKCSKAVLCENLDVQRDTCSSTMKDSKFPPYLELSPGASEAEGTSVMKVCPYNYCSLNGHHHKPATPLRCFLSSRRKLLKTQKVVKPEALSSRKAKFPVPEVGQNEDFFIEICVPEREVDSSANEDSGQLPEILSDEMCSDSEDTVSSDVVEFSPEQGPITPAQDQTVSEFCYNEDVDNSASVSLYEFFGEISDMEWEEGQVDVSVQNGEGYDQDKPGLKSDDKERYYLEDFITDKLKSYFDEDVMEYECFSIAGSVSNSELTQSGEEQNEEQFKSQEEETKSSGENDEIQEGAIYEVPDFQPPEEDCFFSEYIEEITEAGNVGFEMHQVSFETHGGEEAEGNYTGRDMDNEIKGCFATEKKLSTDERVEGGGFNVEKIEKENTAYMTTGLANSKEKNEDCLEAVEAPEITKTEEPEAFTVIKDQPHQTNSSTFCKENGSSQELLDSCNRLKRSIRHKKEYEESEEAREFNPRGPNFLPLQPDPESEKVDLRHQEMDERRNAEELMLDYALQKTVNQLCPARKRKVALLVEAFEAVMPIPKYEPHLQRNSSGFSRGRPIQACS